MGHVRVSGSNAFRYAKYGRAGASDTNKPSKPNHPKVRRPKKSRPLVLKPGKYPPIGCPMNVMYCEETKKWIVGWYGRKPIYFGEPRPL